MHLAHNTLFQFTSWQWWKCCLNELGAHTFYFCPHCQSWFFNMFFLFVYFDMTAMYCILKGFSLYNFGNKIVFIVIVIGIVSNDTRVLVYKWNHLEYYFGIEYRYSTNVTWSLLNISLIKFLKIQVETIYLCKKTSGIPSGFIKTASTQLLNTLFLRTEFFHLQI